MRHTKVDNILETGTTLNADLSSNLLVTIFAYNTPLHDGACFVKGNKILALGLIFLIFIAGNDIYNAIRHKAQGSPGVK